MGIRTVPLFQISFQLFGFDVPVPLTLLPVAEILIAEKI
jgi:hypothetical protein